jgi:hypothetical protein
MLIVPKSACDVAAAAERELQLLLDQEDEALRGLAALRKQISTARATAEYWVDLASKAG